MAFTSHTLTRTHTHSHTHTHKHTRTHTHTKTHAQTQTNTYKHTHKHINKCANAIHQDLINASIIKWDKSDKKRSQTHAFRKDLFVHMLTLPDWFKIIKSHILKKTNVR